MRRRSGWPGSREPAIRVREVISPAPETDVRRSSIARHMAELLTVPPMSRSRPPMSNPDSTVASPASRPDSKDPPRRQARSEADRGHDARAIDSVALRGTPASSVPNPPTPRPPGTPPVGHVPTPRTLRPPPKWHVPTPRPPPERRVPTPRTPRTPPTPIRSGACPHQATTGPRGDCPEPGQSVTGHHVRITRRWSPCFSGPDGLIKPFAPFS